MPEKRENALDISRDSLSFKELIREVQDELMRAEEERISTDIPPLFEVEQLDLEVNFVVTRSAEARTGFALKVVTLGGFDVGGKGGYQDQQVHKVTLSLKAVPEERLSLAADSAEERAQAGGEGSDALVEEDTDIDHLEKRRRGMLPYDGGPR